MNCLVLGVLYKITFCNEDDNKIRIIKGILDENEEDSICIANISYFAELTGPRLPDIDEIWLKKKKYSINNGTVGLTTNTIYRYRLIRKKTKMLVI